MLPNVNAMNYTRALGSLSASLLLAGCAATTPQAFVAFPGNDKSGAAFQQDQAICQQHAISHTGYGLPSEPAVQPADGNVATTMDGGATSPNLGSGATTAGVVSAPAMAGIPDEISYAQCMAARGDTVLPIAKYYDEEYAYNPNGFGYGSDYAYAYPFYGTGLVGGFGFYGFNGGHHHGYHNGAYNGGWAGHGHGHGSWGGHGGWGGHSGGGHGGGGHGGGGHGGGGH
jgi:hypothetical protein